MMPHPAMRDADRAEYIQQIKAQSTNWHRVGKALANFLSAAFPQTKNEAEELGLSIIALNTTGDDEQIKRLSEPPAVIYGPGPVAMLARLVGERDRIASQIEMAERGLEVMRGNDAFDGYADLLEASTLGPLRGMLAQTEEQISAIQLQIESQV